MEKIGLVVTSISKPNQVLKALAQGCLKHRWDFVMVGDVSSPKGFDLKGCDYYDIDRQGETKFYTAKKCLTKHYARKNIGYLVAMAKGARIIVETDDDNFPEKSFWLSRERIKKARFIKQKSWVNVYQYFSDKLIWPRGFPLSHIHQKKADSLLIKKIECPIQQGLANGNPDVDAIYRLVMPLPVRFKESDDIALEPQSWCPFNSQNTTWFQEAFPLMYLPSYCSFRMTDIYRSLIAQRIAWENNWSILFHKPTVYQKRNEHNLMKDFTDEVPGYLQVENIQEALNKITLKSGIKNIPNAMRKCYRTLVDKKIFDAKEMNVLEAWLKDLNSF